MGSEPLSWPVRPGPFGVRLLILAGLLGAGLAAAAYLGLSAADLLPNAGGWQVAGEFFGRALRPALDYEAAYVPENTPPLLVKALRAAGTTVLYAAAAILLSVIVGMALALLATSAWWSLARPVAGRRRSHWLRASGLALTAVARLLIALMRSVHELLWAVLLLAAVGISNVAAVVAIAIPYAGTLAKVYAELIEESAPEAAAALAEAGASPAQAFLFGLFPRALPDLLAYSFYRFECALRSAAVLGFFGFPTLGYYIAASFENLHYGEVWTYLYALLALIAFGDWWSSALRRRVVA